MDAETKVSRSALEGQRRKREGQGMVSRSNMADSWRRRTSEEEPLDFATGRSWGPNFIPCNWESSWPPLPLTGLACVKPSDWERRSAGTCLLTSPHGSVEKPWPAGAMPLAAHRSGPHSLARLPGRVRPPPRQLRTRRPPGAAPCSSCRSTCHW